MNATGSDKGGKRVAGGVVVAIAAATALLAGASLAQAPQAPPGVSAETRTLGTALFGDNCAACHDGGVNRAPPTDTLRQLAPDAILHAMLDGPMKAQAASLSLTQKIAISESLTGQLIGAEDAAAPPLMCAAGAAWFDRAMPPPLPGWGFGPGNAHAVDGAIAGVNRGNVGKLRLKWALAFPKAVNARSQPTIAGGALYVGGEDGKVYALDPASGCAHWVFAAQAPVRTGIAVDGWKAGDAQAAPRLYFGDATGRAYAVDAVTGSLVWQHAMDSHPAAMLTGTPTVHDNTLFVPVSSWEEVFAADAKYPCCTFRGSLVALDSATGAEQWRTWLVDTPVKQGETKAGVAQLGPSGVALWSAPLVDEARGQVIVTTGDNYSTPASDLSDAFVAIDMKTGKINWAHQALAGDSFNLSCYIEVERCPEENGPDFDFGSGAMLAKGVDGADYLLAGQKSGTVLALDPANGKLRWSRRVGRGGALGGIHFGMAVKDGKVYVPVSDFPDGRTYDMGAKPGVFALRLVDGEPLWSAPAPDVCNGKPLCGPGYSAPVTVTEDLVFAGSTDGHLRILDAATGAQLWDFDTVQPYQTVNGAVGQGGSMSGGAAALPWRGMVFINSGFGNLSKIPGNVLLAFAVE